jgi:RNA polymerase sigma-70 factor (ECF subfamily)
LIPERDQRCIHLRAEGLCYRDIAKTLGVSLGSVAKSIVRAIDRLSAADME